MILGRDAAETTTNAPSGSMVLTSSLILHTSMSTSYASPSCDTSDTLRPAPALASSDMAACLLLLGGGDCLWGCRVGFGGSIQGVSAKRGRGHRGQCTQSEARFRDRPAGVWGARAARESESCARPAALLAAPWVSSENKRKKQEGAARRSMEGRKRQKDPVNQSIPGASRTRA